MPPSKARKTVAPQVHQRAAERDRAQPALGDLRPHVAGEPNKGAKRAARHKRVERAAKRANKALGAARSRIAPEPGAERVTRKRVARSANGANKAKGDGARGSVRPRVARAPSQGAGRTRVVRAAGGAKKVAARRAQLSHLDARGQARMVEISEKPITARTAVAQAELRMLPETMRVLRSGRAAKGDVLAVARVAGIQAAKRTPELIPLCHAIALTKSEIVFQFSKTVLTVEARVSALDRTGAEMEALTAASIAALTVYDMLKAIDRGMTIERVELHEKHGGKTGSWRRGTHA